VWAPDARVPTIGTYVGDIRTWQGALDYIACLNTNNYLGPNDRRLPDRKAMRNLIHYGMEEIKSREWKVESGGSTRKSKVLFGFSLDYQRDYQGG
jgi:hypothetical protein